MNTPLRARWILGAFALFAMASLAGLAFGTLGSIAIVRGLGWIAVLAASLGCLFQLILLHDAEPALLSRLRARLSTQLAGLSSGIRRQVESAAQVSV